MWSRKIWREIDLRQKVNHPIYYPQRQKDEGTIDRKNLFDVILHAATNPDVELKQRLFLYSTLGGEYDDEFNSEPLSLDQINELMEGQMDSVVMTAANGIDDSLDIFNEPIEPPFRGGKDRRN